MNESLVSKSKSDVDPQILELRERLFSGKDIFIREDKDPIPNTKNTNTTIISIDDLEPLETETESHKGEKKTPNMANADITSDAQWYEQHPELLEAEKKAMASFLGTAAKLRYLGDGCAYWLVKCHLNIPEQDNRESRSYTLALVYDRDFSKHPKFGKGIKVYLLNPMVEDLISVVNQTSGVFPKCLPHLLPDEHGIYYLAPVITSPAEAERFREADASAVSSLSDAFRWLTYYELGIRDKDTWWRFTALGLGGRI